MMKFSLLLATLSASYALDNFEDEKSAFMLETEDFWQRELQASAGPGGGGGGSGQPCGLAPGTRRNQILNTLRRASANNRLNSPGTPQNLAANWLINDDAFLVCPGDEKLMQRYVMALFYYSTEGSSWSSCGQVGACSETNFLSAVHECEWAGTTCNSDLCITEIMFENNNVGGTLPFELEQLEDLEVLSLEQGSLTSSIPAEFGELKNLRVLDLDFNMLTGRIPQTIYGLTALEQLDLNSNKLTGQLSPAVGNLENLRLLQLYENLMTGQIPGSLGNAEDLVIAEFFNNTFVGSMPQSVCDNRAPPDGTGAITGLTSDCFPNPTPQIECSCCTGCAVF